MKIISRQKKDWLKYNISALTFLLHLFIVYLCVCCVVHTTACVWGSVLTSKSKYASSMRSLGITLSNLVINAVLHHLISPFFLSFFFLLFKKQKNDDSSIFSNKMEFYRCSVGSLDISVLLFFKKRTVNSEY